MTKRMLIDATQEEETRVVVVNGNKLEDVEFETSCRKQIKGNIYLGKVMRVEPSLQACFVDYGGNKHGFLAFGEIHPDYYFVSDEQIKEVEQEVEEIIENKKQYIKEREAARQRAKLAREQKLADMLAQQEVQEAQETQEASTLEVSEPTPCAEDCCVLNQEQTVTDSSAPIITENSCSQTLPSPENIILNIAEEILQHSIMQEAAANEQNVEQTEQTQEDEEHKKERIAKKRRTNKRSSNKNKKQRTAQKTTSLAETYGIEENCIHEDSLTSNDSEEDSLSDDDDEDEENDNNFELQRRLIKVRKLYHRNKIQDVIKEGQIVLVQIVKEERGNKGAALTTYLSLAGRYCVLMPNRIKSGGVSRKITNAGDRKRLKDIVKELPLNIDMSLIVRTAGEDKTKSDIVRDYNYLIRSWNNTRINALKSKAPALIYEEGNLIKRALRDIYSKEVSEILVAGEKGYRLAKDFFKILSPHNLKKIKSYRDNDMPLFQRFQVETQLDKLHDTVAQLDSGGYLVINPTEALVAIDVNSGRATKENDLEETALKTNLEACDEVARQLRMRNLAGLVVVDFIDMDEPQNNHLVEKRMKEALKKDRSRVQVGRMSQFGLLELSRQRMHSSFFESNYHVCPYCQGRGIVRSVESAAMMVLRSIEEEGTKNRSSQLNITAATDVALYLLNHKKENLVNIEKNYNMNIIISADSSIRNIVEFKLERTKAQKLEELDNNVVQNNETKEEEVDNFASEDLNEYKANRNQKNYRRNPRKFRKNDYNKSNQQEQIDGTSMQNNVVSTQPENVEQEAPKKATWWKKLIKK